MNQTNNQESGREQSANDSYRALIRLLQLVACRVVQRIKGQQENQNGSEGQQETSNGR